MAGNDFNLDRQEYQSVFKVFDKDNTGEITISQVYDLINKFDDAQKLNNLQSSGQPSSDVSMINTASNNAAGGGYSKAGTAKGATA